MEFWRGRTGATTNLALVAVVLAAMVEISAGQGLVPGVMIFGDSVVDAGNNNNLATLVRADFPPYGRDFLQHKPTGRFCNGKLATDFTVENLGFTSYPPAYLSNEAAGTNLLNGANFASAASGYLNSTANLYHAIPLAQQVQYYKEYQSKVETIAGREKARTLFSGSIYILSAGNSDFIQNYYVNPMLSGSYTPDQFSGLLAKSFTNFVQNVYDLGARRVGVTSLPPMGCLPAAIALFGGGNNGCVTRLNNDAVAFNTKINTAAEALKRSHPDLRLVIFDIYKPLLDLINNPGSNGFFESKRACCGTGTIETSLLCNTGTLGTCINATGYVFWDSFHPSEAANRVLSDALLLQGIDLIS
ncbi:GDSL esterase/lipase At5g03820-like [Zingiber officinale]|uniref:GDSL esterase/lipase At5g03820-like n=1 Tax=Zingiber officinale TaxID=94328 RepID=UPI001C4BBC5B|nr:GDSL esterase/lipase At5g03820-like [Zingiber officinale]